MARHNPRYFYKFKLDLRSHLPTIHPWEWAFVWSIIHIRMEQSSGTPSPTHTRRFSKTAVVIDMAAQAIQLCQLMQEISKRLTTLEDPNPDQQTLPIPIGDLVAWEAQIHALVKQATTFVKSSHHPTSPQWPITSTKSHNGHTWWKNACHSFFF